MRRRRALYSSSSDQPWYQNSSDAQRAANSAPTAQWHWTAIYYHLPYPNTIHHLRVLKFAFEPILQTSHIELVFAEYLFEQKLSACHIDIFLVIGFYISARNLLYNYYGQGNNTLDYNCQDDRIRDKHTYCSGRCGLSSTHEYHTRYNIDDIKDSIICSDFFYWSCRWRWRTWLPPSEPKREFKAFGGDSRSLAGIALIGLLFLFLFRRRKRRPPYHEKHEVTTEPRMSSSSQALPSAIAAAGAPRHSDRSIVPQRSPSGRPHVIDHNLIHMDLNHWDRPFAHEDPHPRDDSSPLRLMNPDPTPTPPIILTASSSVSPENNPHRFLQRQRSALAAALLSVKRSFSSQDVVPRHASEESHTHTSAHPSAHPSPLHIQDKSNKLTMPSEVILAGASATESRPMSSQSAMSNNTIIRHHAPDDPFVSSPAVTSPLPGCLQPGHNDGIARRDFLAPPPLRTRVPVPCTPTQHGAVSPLTRSNSDCSTRFESLSSPTRSEVSSVSVRSGPFDLASASVVDGDGGREGERVILQRNGAERIVLQRYGADRVILQRGQREQTPNWEVHVYPGT
ncbi:hypothetical protein D6D19_05378 [Aureobasidium pullulans]|uniref:Uncharacterized protein n=1 Tax=Aureobasidium pullulans TaxID=5580 RepID=A0A4S9A4H2_AURPU|nr:hypothetical protein D6D19_05378 [Aureobasidium pullulans]